MLRSSPFFFKKDSGPAGRVVPSNQVKNEFANVETYNTRQESLKRDTAALEFSRKFLWFIPHTFALTVMCPLPHQCWATRILKRWDRCYA